MTSRQPEELKQLYIMECENGHNYERTNIDDNEYTNKCPKCGSYITEIIAGKWI